MAPFPPNGSDASITKDAPKEINSMEESPPYEKGDDVPIAVMTTTTTRGTLLEDASQCKESGNAHFSEKKYEKAAQSYMSGLNIVEKQRHHQQQTTQESEWDDIEVALRSNLAIVFLRVEQYQQAREECTKALELDSTNAKVWYRRGSAYEGLYLQTRNDDKLQSAVSDLVTCLSHFAPEPVGPQQQMKAAAQEALKRLQQDAHIGSNGDGGDKSDQSSSSFPSPTRQRQDVVRLLMARQMIAEQRTAAQKSNKKQNRPSHAPLDGEAYFLLNWSWWNNWCRAVDFFYLSENENNTNKATTIRVGKRQREVLRLLPPGASIPVKKRITQQRWRSPNDSSDDDSDQSDQENEASAYALEPIDNTSLLFLPQDTTSHNVFLYQWNPYLLVEDSGTETRNGKQHVIQTEATEQTSLRPNLVRGYHYEVLPREVYFALRVWYGEVTPSICRRAVSGGSDVVLPMYPLQAPTALTSSPLHRRGRLCTACRAPYAKSRCKRCLSTYYCNRACQESHWAYHRASCKEVAVENGKGTEPLSERDLLASNNNNHDWGRIGLNNLGNTCFMNSAIQCLSHSTPLTRHFLSNRFRTDLNSTNALGTGGKLANAYDSVMKDIWMGGKKYSSTSPTALKRAIAMFAPRFAGTSQHDAQEFLAYLLDGLHEDLNRIRDPPYIEMPDVTNGQNMDIAGAEAWDAHRRRNDSLVMDTFYGQFKSTCVCPRCNRVSVSFDAFNHISLEIPQLDNMPRTVSMILFRSAAAGSATSPTRYGVTVRRNESVGDLRRALAELCQVPTDRLAVCDVYESAIYEILNDGKPVSSIRSTDVLAAYEVDPYTNTTIHAIVSHSHRGSNPRTKEKDNDSELSEEKELFNFPFLTSFNAELTCKEVWNHVWNQCCTMVDPELGYTNEAIHTDKKPVEGSVESRQRSSLQIRIVDNTSQPRPLFLDADVIIVPTDGSDSSSVLPADSDSKIMTYLGKDCAERFLFLRLEWSQAGTVVQKGTDREEVEALVIDKDRYSHYVDHPSLAEALQKQRSMNGKKGVTLEQCFETFTRPERLDENNKWYCSVCKDHVRAMKTMRLWRLPNVLVVHLKRFEFKHALRRDKLDTLVDFPLENLDMSGHCAKSIEEQWRDSEFGQACFVEDAIPAMYDLFGVTNHYGRMGFGHYTAFARKWDEEGMSSDWALFDDSTARSVGDGTGRGGGQSVVTPSAYVLFYRRRVFI